MRRLLLALVAATALSGAAPALGASGPRLQGVFHIEGRGFIQSPSGVSEGPFEFNRRFTPVCRQGACDVRVKATNFRVRLERAGLVYRRRIRRRDEGRTEVTKIVVTVTQSRLRGGRRIATRIDFRSVVTTPDGSFSAVGKGRRTGS